MGLRRLAGCTIAVAIILLMFGVPAFAQLMIIGNDQKVKLDNGTNVMQPPGHDTLSIVDTSKPADLKPARPTGSGTLPSRRIARFLGRVNDRIEGLFAKPPVGFANACS